MPYLPYEEPGISTILSLASFLLLLNISRYILDHLLYCGIVGEILIGIIWGLPVGGTSWLTQGAQETVQALGYLGLIGLVFQGGLDTSLTLLRQNAHTSVAVATIGLLVPIALSFLLLVLPFSSSGVKTYPTPLAAFSAGASLCSTSLGTTFAILSSANMQRTRVGVVLVGAALMDDVVGLVMVNIVTTLGNGENGGWPIARPIVASFGLLLLTLVICQYALKPVWRWLLSVMGEGAQLDPPINPIHNRHNMATKLVRKIPHLSFILSAFLLISFVTIAAFIKASVLFAAFIAGGVVSFLWSQGSRQQQSGATLQDGQSKMYEEYFKPAMDHILVPFFFVSYETLVSATTAWIHCGRCSLVKGSSSDGLLLTLFGDGYWP
jgi:Kef-type K+ transport system membrane component KefB